MRTRLVKNIGSWYKIVPTSLTLANSLCGFGAILYTLTAYSPNNNILALLSVSAWWIIGAMIFDMLDGWTARVLNAFSPHGLQMDSLADMVTFGVAPAVIIAVMAHTNKVAWIPYSWAWVFCAIYLGCTALRLALYNVKSYDPQKKNGDDDFYGLPSPGGAAAVCSIIILHSYPGSSHSFLLELLPLYAAILGALMITPIPYMHLGHWLGSKRKNKIKTLILIVFFVIFAWNPRLIAALAINFYVLSGPISILGGYFSTKMAKQR